MLYNIEIGDKSNLDQILRLNKRVFQGLNKSELVSRDSYEDNINKKKSLILLVKEGKMIVGDSVAFVRGKNYHIWLIALSVDHIKHGIAKRLITMNKQIARDSKFEAITITVYDAQKELVKAVVEEGFSVYRKNMKEGFQDYKIEF